MPDEKDDNFARSMQAHREKLAKREARRVRFSLRRLRPYRGPLITLYLAGVLHRLALGGAAGTPEGASVGLLFAPLWGFVFPVQFVLGFVYTPAQALDAWVDRPVGGLILIAGVIWLAVRVARRRPTSP